MWSSTGEAHPGNATQVDIPPWFLTWGGLKSLSITRSGSQQRYARGSTSSAGGRRTLWGNGGQEFWSPESQASLRSVGANCLSQMLHKQTSTFSIMDSGALQILHSFVSANKWTLKNATQKCNKGKKKHKKLHFMHFLGAGVPNLQKHASCINIVDKCCSEIPRLSHKIQNNIFLNFWLQGKICLKMRNF